MAGSEPNQSVALLLFSRICRIGRSDPLLRPLPTHAEALERGADRLAGDALTGDPFGTTDRRRQIERSETRRLAEGARRLVDHGAQPFRCTRIEGGGDPVGAGRPLGQGSKDGLVEGVDGVADGLVVAAEVRGDPRCTFAARGGAEDLAAAQGEGIGRTQPGHQCIAFGIRQRADEDWSSHTGEATTLPTISSETIRARSRLRVDMRVLNRIAAEG